jgi:rSAM/selenodomain-associated transferase 1
MKYPQVRILVFCKAPLPGRVKTRLAHAIGRREAAGLHELLARHCLRAMTASALAPVELWCAPDQRHEFFQQCHADFKVELRSQVDGDLGRRMEHALRDALTQVRHAILVGTDCPGLDADYLERTILQLLTGGTVIAPAEDGGYALIGSDHCRSEVFRRIDWGGDQVLHQTLARLQGRVELLPTLWDVDRCEDVARLAAEADQLKLEDDLRRFLAGLPRLAG